MIPRILEQLQTGRQEFSWSELCSGLIPLSTVLRWKARVKTGQVVVQEAGPKKKPLLDGATLRRQIRQLPAGPRRTAGSAQLHQQWSEFISRRQFQEMVAQERQNKIDDMKRITWHRPGVAWSLDTTEYGAMKISPLRDLASKYQIPMPLIGHTENGAQIALYLDGVFRKEGAPLFLKRDMGSPLNCLAVDDVLERHLVLPLNSPPGYPRYNGSAERAMQDLKKELDHQHQRALMQNMPMALELELATHELNHKPRRVLDGLTPCQVYHDPHRRLRLHGALRRRLFRGVLEQFWQIAQCMPERNRHTLSAAWRLLVEDWLRRHQWISVRVNRQTNVSTNSNDFFSQN
jgi:transposase InsO family protein